MNKKMFIPVCLAFLSLGLAACDNTTPTSGESNSVTPSHTHTWAENWTNDGTNHWHACTDTSCTEVNGKVAHSGGTATCQEKAVCEVCEAEYGELAGHAYSETWTCTAEGHYKTCTTEGCDQKTETTAHSGGEATCKAKGTCSECGEAYGEFGQHSWESVADSDFLASKATCTTQATYYKSCAICGETSTETFEGGDLLPHSGGTATCEELAVCDVCEQPYGELAAHTPGAEATLDNPQVCTVCGHIITPALGHTEADPKAEWSTSDTYHWHDCQGCNEHITSKGEHSGGTATCDSKAVCSTCEKEYGEKLAHSWDYTSITVTTLPTSEENGVAKMSCENCEEKFDVVLPKEATYAASFETYEEGAKARFVLSVDEESVATVVAANSTLDSTKLTAAVETFTENKKPSELGYSYLLVVNGQLVNASFTLGGENKAAVSYKLNENDKVQFYCDDTRVVFNAKADSSLPEGGYEFTATSKGFYSFYLNNSDELWHQASSTIYDQYTLYVGGVENAEAAVTPSGTDFAQFEATLSVNDVVTIKGDDTLLVFPAYEDATQFVATVEGAHTFYVNNENKVYVVAPTTGGGNVDPDGLVLYLVPNSNWTADNPRYAAYFFGNGEKWVDMTDSNSDGIYEVVAPTGYPSVIFCRMSPSATANNWNNKWNQTDDLTVPSDDKVKYTVEPNTWDKGAGAWSKLDEEPTFGEKPVDNNWYLRGTVTGWDALEQYVLTQDGEQYTITIDLAKNDEVKFTLSKEWSTAYGYANLEEGCKNLVGGTDNIVITTAGTYTFYIKPATQSIWVEIAEEEHTHQESGTWTVEGNEHWKACSGCNEKLYLGTHEGGTATCEELAVCTVCKKPYGELAEHTPEVVEAVAPKCEETGLTEGSRCSVCKEVLVEQETVDALEHTGGTATCEELAVCTVCSNPYGELADHEYGTLIQGNANSCDDEGTLSHYQCSVCDKYFTEAKVETTWDDLQVSAEGHTYGELVAAQEATCTKDGHAAYYQCSVCEKYFTEVKEETTLEALVVLAGHAYGELIEVEGATCTEDGHAAYYYCEKCETYFTQTKEETTLETLTVKAGHAYGELVAVQEATCTEDGQAAYYQCSVCEKYFTEAKEETTLEALTVKAGHAYGELVAAQEATCTKDGHAAYYQCSVCEKYFTEVKEETTLEALTEETTGHSWDYTSLTVATIPVSGKNAGVAKMSCENCTDKLDVVLPQEATYVALFETYEEGAKARFVLSVDEQSVATVVAANSTLDATKLTAAVETFTENKKPSELGYSYLLVVNGQLVNASFTLGGENKAEVSCELSLNDKVQFYSNENRVVFKTGGSALPEGGYEFTATVNGSYTFYLNKSDQLWNTVTAAAYSQYTLYVGGVENAEAAVTPSGTDFAQFEATLSVNDVVTIKGDDTLLAFPLYENATQFEVVTEGAHTFYVNNENKVYVVAPTTGGGDVDPDGLVLYLVPNSNWKVDNARFAAYFFGNGETWVSMVDSNKDGIYEVEAPAGYPNVIFCRMNPSATANNWNNRWNQTADLTVPTDDKVKYTVQEGTWDKGGGTWSTL